MLCPPCLSVDRHGKGLPDAGMFDHRQVEPLPSPVRREPPLVATSGSVLFQTVYASSVSLNGTRDAVALTSPFKSSQSGEVSALLTVLRESGILSGSRVLVKELRFGRCRSLRI